MIRLPPGSKRTDTLLPSTTLFRSYGEQHYSPLDEVNRDTVSRLELAWSVDLPLGNSVTGPVAVDGVLYTATGYSVVRAFDAATGRQLWDYDPGAPAAAGRKLRQGWGSRGNAWWNGKVYTGPTDGRLIATEAKTSKPLRSEEHTSELQSLMRISYAVFCLKKKKKTT